MIEVVIDSIRISLVSQHRIVLLREVDSERQLPIWIGPCEAEAITIELQDVKAVSYTHLRAHETVLDLVCRLLLEKTNNQEIDTYETIKSTKHTS